MDTLKKLPRKKLALLRSESYKAPDLDAPRCETCTYCSLFGGDERTCCVVIFPNERLPRVHPFGVCDLWKEKTDER